MLESIWTTFCKSFGSQAFWRQVAVGRCGCYNFEKSPGSACFLFSRLINLQVKYMADLGDCHSTLWRVCDMRFCGWLTISLLLRSKSEHLPGCPCLPIVVLVLLQLWPLVPAAFATLISPTHHVFLPAIFYYSVPEDSPAPLLQPCKEWSFFIVLLSCSSKTSSALPYSYVSHHIHSFFE